MIRFERAVCCAFAVILFGAIALAEEPASRPATPEAYAAPESEGVWIRPSSAHPAEPRWGIAGGIQFGIWPSSRLGPRGLIRIYAPYLGYAEDRTINFIAIEPMIGIGRSFSELEMSQLDDMRGVRFWSVDSIDQAGVPKVPWEPARGEILRVPDGRGGDVEALRVVIVTEPFRAGMQVAVEAVVREDNPHEIRLRTYMIGEEAKAESCVLSATMGNFMRLRQLWLKDEMMTSHDLYPGFVSSDFAPHRIFPADQLFRPASGGVLIAATPDEEELGDAEFHPDARDHWREAKGTCTQYWRVEEKHVHEALRAQVNGRYTYWASQAPIPGGVSFENFEMVDEYHEGQEFIFGISEKRISGPLKEECDKLLGYE